MEDGERKEGKRKVPLTRRDKLGLAAGHTGCLGWVYRPTKIVCVQRRVEKQWEGFKLKFSTLIIHRCTFFVCPRCWRENGEPRLRADAWTRSKLVTDNATAKKKPEKREKKTRWLILFHLESFVFWILSTINFVSKNYLKQRFTYKYICHNFVITTTILNT